MSTSKSNSIKKSRHAVAIQYDSTIHQAPTIIAKGEGEIAQEIINLAIEHGIFTHEDALLAEALSQFDTGSEVPDQLYVVIAELVAFSYLLQGKYPENWRGPKHIHAEC